MLLVRLGGEDKRSDWCVLCFVLTVFVRFYMNFVPALCCRYFLGKIHILLTIFFVLLRLLLFFSLETNLFLVHYVFVVPSVVFFRSRLID